MLFGGGAFSQWSVVCEMVLAAGKARDEKVVLGAIGRLLLTAHNS